MVVQLDKSGKMSGFNELLLNGVSSCWKSPSNIALVKYWGKRGNQIPANASISITLSEAYTITKVKAKPASKPGLGPEVLFWFEGEHNSLFSAKIENFLKDILPFMPYLDQVTLEIESGNNFPHSAGIASSASGMSALAICLCSIENQLLQQPVDDNEFKKKVSFISRIGSGSACRSVFDQYAVWGKHQDVEGSADEYAVPLNFEPHGSMKNIHDTIFIVDPTAKKVSSRVGHNLMNGHVFAEARYEQAKMNMSQILKAIRAGDWDLFAAITENEALSLHAMMMSSSPGYVLMHPNSLIIIDKIVNFRKQTGAKLCFTLDAGPNIHLLYPHQEMTIIRPLVSELKDFCYNNSVIEDMMGSGPAKLNCR